MQVIIPSCGLQYNLRCSRVLRNTARGFRRARQTPMIQVLEGGRVRQVKSIIGAGWGTRTSKREKKKTPTSTIYILDWGSPNVFSWHFRSTRRNGARKPLSVQVSCKYLLIALLGYNSQTHHDNVSGFDVNKLSVSTVIIIYMKKYEWRQTEQVE